MAELMKTHLNEFHRRFGHLVEFAGFEMPIWYEGIIPEHLAVRNAVGIFDTTHMGRCVVDGKDAGDFLNHVLTRDVASLSLDQGRYSVMCNELGGIMDDLVVFRLKEQSFLVVYNASNRKKDYGWLSSHSNGFQAEVKDVSDEIAMFAVQGPKALDTLRVIADSDLTTLRFYWGRWVAISDFKVFVTRTGYTGEDGFELYLWNTPLAEAERAERLWQNIVKAGHEHGIRPCGLGARDTLRLEAGMCLYGNDINEDISPLEAGLGFVAQFEKQDFIGKEALLRQKSEGTKKIRVGIRALDRRIPRSGDSIFLEGREIGQVTSGTFSPLLKLGIAMGYVLSEHSEVGTEIDVKSSKTIVHAEIAAMPFYDETRYGRRRKSA